MTATKYNARDCEFEIEDLDTPDTWLPIGPGAVNTFTKSTDEETADTTTFGSEGQAESQKMQISKSLTLEGFRLKDKLTGALDPGQEMVERLSELLGDESLGRLRFAAPGDTSWEVWTTHVKMGDEGGGNNDKVSWSAEFTRSGAATTMAKA
jgi:hypothetical protein